MTLGVETKDGGFIPIIHRESVVPTKGSVVLTTVIDEQEIAEIHVLYGEHTSAAHNRSMTNFTLRLTPGPRGVCRLRVSIAINSSAVVSVGARDLDSGRRAGGDIYPVTIG